MAKVCVYIYTLKELTTVLRLVNYGHFQKTLTFKRNLNEKNFVYKKSQYKSILNNVHIVRNSLFIKNTRILIATNDKTSINIK